MVLAGGAHFHRAASGVKAVGRCDQTALDAVVLTRTPLRPSFGRFIWGTPRARERTGKTREIVVSAERRDRPLPPSSERDVTRPPWRVWLTLRRRSRLERALRSSANFMSPDLFYFFDAPSLFYFLIIRFNFDS
jgi:hypothetical protein